jgi:ribosomal protein S18 acetylase RimI-like enzyme
MSDSATPESFDNRRGLLSGGPAKSVGESTRTEIRPCRAEDLVRIAEIHKSQFLTPGTLLGHFSPALIASLYRTFLDRSIFLVHASDGEVDGFVLGGSARVMTACRLSFFRNRAVSCIGEVICRPRLWVLAFRSFLKLVAKRFSSVMVASQRDEFRLLSIAVAAGAVRKGVGTKLVQAFEEAIRDVCCTYSLNVLKTNTAALRFYETLDFQRIGETVIAWRLRKVLAVGAGQSGARSS